MNAGVIAIAALGGYIAYDKLFKAPGAVDAGAAKQVSGTNAWPSWLNIGNQPATANGQNPTDTASSVANAAGAFAGLATSIVNYFGTADKNQTAGATNADYYSL